VPASVFVLHRNWIRTASDRFVLDPGIPEARDWITSIVAEVVQNYPIDGVQFDDYFYTETASSPLNDNETFRRYGQGYASKGDWRRHNTQQLIAQVSATIKKLNPNVEFGVSPAGVWRNRSHDPAGSDTRGAAAYDESYADTRSWVQQGLLDYIAPQIYWPFARDAARYDVLANWWAEVVKPTHTRLYIGVALYKVGEPSKNEPDWTVDGGVPELKNSSISMSPCRRSRAPSCSAKTTSISRRPARRLTTCAAAGGRRRANRQPASLSRLQPLLQAGVQFQHVLRDGPPDVGGKVRRQRPAGAFDGLRHAVGKLAQDRQHLLPGKLTALAVARK
jgi:hypothetical protein